MSDTSAYFTTQQSAASSLRALADAAEAGLCAVPPNLRSTPEGCLLDRLGIELTHVGIGRARATMTVGAIHLNQRGVAQGGALVAFADATAGWASEASLASGSYSTVELKCNLLAAVGSGVPLVAVARPTHLGRRTLVHDVDVLRAADEAAHERRLVAHFSCTQLVLTEY